MTRREGERLENAFEATRRRRRALDDLLGSPGDDEGGDIYCLVGEPLSRQTDSRVMARVAVLKPRCSLAIEIWSAMAGGPLTIMRAVSERKRVWMRAPTSCENKGVSLELRRLEEKEGDVDAQ